MVNLSHRDELDQEDHSNYYDLGKHEPVGLFSTLGEFKARDHRKGYARE